MLSLFCFVNIPTQFEKKTNSTSNNNAVWRNEGIKDVQEIKLWRKMCKSLLAILWFRDILFMNNHVLKKGYWIGFVLGIFVPLENFSLKWRRHHYRWRAANFDLYSALMAIEQWGFFCVPHLLWLGASVYNGHLRGSVTLTPIAKRLTVELSLPVFQLGSIAAGTRTLNFPLVGQTP